MPDVDPLEQILLRHSEGGADHTPGHQGRLHAGPTPIFDAAARARLERLVISVLRGIAEAATAAERVFIRLSRSAKASSASPAPTPERIPIQF